MRLATLILSFVLLGIVCGITLFLLSPKSGGLHNEIRNTALINVRMCMEHPPSTEEHLSQLSLAARQVIDDSLPDGSNITVRLVRISSDGIPLQSIINVSNSTNFTLDFHNAMAFCVDTCFELSGVEPQWSIGITNLANINPRHSAVTFRSTCNLSVSDPITYVLNVDFCQLDTRTARHDFIENFQQDVAAFVGAAPSDITVSDLQTTCDVQEYCTNTEIQSIDVPCPSEITFRLPVEYEHALPDIVTDSTLPGLLENLISIMTSDTIDCATASAWVHQQQNILYNKKK